MNLTNKVLNLDCLEVLKQLPGKSVDLLLTDPPFNLAYAGRTENFELFKNDSLKPDEHTAWLYEVLKETKRVLRPGASLYVFVDWRNYPRFYNILDGLFHVKHCIVWNKNVIGTGQYFRFQHEFILYAHNGKGATFNVEKKNIPDILNCSRVRPLTHPTQKPVALLKQLIEFSSNPGDTVLDLFAGVFSTAVAAKETNRNFICCELDENYCAIGEERLKD